MKLAPYPEYRETGETWFKNVPAHWKTLPLCAVARTKSITNCVDRELLSVYLDLGVIRFSDVKEKRTNATSEDLSKYQAVDPGDFVLNNQQAWRGSVGVSKYSGIVSPAYLVLEVHSELYPDYANVLFRDRKMVNQYLVSSKGVGSIQRNLYWPHLKRATVAIPPVDEQVRIAKVVKSKAAQINKFIRNKRQLIELLKEQKQNVINQAVTRGLDPKVKFKPSGVEWIGDIPEHWEEIPLKQIARADNSGSYGVEPELGEVVLPVATTAQIDKDGKFLVRKMPIRGFSAAEANRYSCKPGEILVVKSSGSISNVITGKAGIFTEDTPDFAFSNFLMRLTAKREKVLPLYLFYLLTSHLTRERVKRMVAGSTYPNLRVGEYLSSKLPLPEVEEQSAICDFIQNEAAIIDQAITRAEREIELMREYRTRLISDVVTGQVDVRNMKCEGGSLNEDEFEDIEEVEEEIELPEGGEDDE